MFVREEDMKIETRMKDEKRENFEKCPRIRVILELS
jgi:hypothetical protein